MSFGSSRSSSTPTAPDPTPFPPLRYTGVEKAQADLRARLLFASSRARSNVTGQARQRPYDAGSPAVPGGNLRYQGPTGRHTTGFSSGTNLLASGRLNRKIGPSRG